MKARLWLRFGALALVFALLMSAAFLVALGQLIGRPSAELERNLVLFYAQVAEQQPYQAALARAGRYRWQSAPTAPRLWVIDERGQVLAASPASARGAPPATLLALERAQAVHAISNPARARWRTLSGDPGQAAVRLDTPSPAWLLIEHSATPRRGFLGFLALFVVTLLCASFFGLFMVALYLRGRSAQARRVIAALQAGQLGARFRIDRLDAAGGLMLDFNRMADDIESLVGRLERTERERRELLQELGHDLRTPLTSVRTAADTLALHGEAMAPSERADFQALLVSEVDYLARLLDDLLVIADIDDAACRQQRVHVDVWALAAAEAKLPRGRAEVHLQPAPGQAAVIEGDPYLLARLLRNLFDNAARHAAARVEAGYACHEGALLLWIDDDGAGMDAAQAAAFGRRRSRRSQPGQDSTQAERGSGVSLGLGSVIATKIAALHGARIEIGRSAALGGARVAVRFGAAAQKVTTNLAPAPIDLA